MTSKLFVGNLSFESTKEDLVDLFSQFGTVVDVHIPVDRMSGRPRGFAFVEMSSPEEATQALEQVHDTELSGRKLRLDLAEERAQRGGGGFGGGDDRPGGRGGFKNKGRGKGSRRNLRARKRGF